MMVIFISQCEKKALKRTRQVLDAFANRIGDYTWQSVITQEGLNTVKMLLRKTASKSTAVSCHWIRSRSRIELVWVVGNKSKFNHDGIVPVNSTLKSNYYRDDLSDWHFLPLIQSLASLAALLHDWGKASARFQEKITKEYIGKSGDALRHEWVSCLLLKALIINTDSSNDNEWLNLLINCDIDEKKLIKLEFNKFHPLKDLPITAKLVAWLIITHHRMPFLPSKEIENNWAAVSAESIERVFSYIEKNWGYANEKAEETLQDCLSFPRGLMSNSAKWLKPLKRWAQKLLDQQKMIEQIMKDNSYRPILHHARLCLMLGDHYYSSLLLKESGEWKENTELTANTQRNGDPKQALAQHLIGVYEQTKRNVQKLPKLESELPVTENINALKKKSSGRFHWQDKAASKVSDWTYHHKDKKHGFFAVNMASTGCGKTFANAKIMLSLSKNKDRLRYVLALGLRTLTLQTGDEYRERIFRRKDGSDLAVLIGSKAILDLHEKDGYKDLVKPDEEQGSESRESLLGESDDVDYEGDFPEDGMATIFQDNKARKFLYAPILACTIDHIMSATETTRGGRYILPCLRLMSSDLVIDEVDDFTDADVIAIGRLIYLAGMYGKKVMVSSATIPPALAEGYFNSYREGWRMFNKTRNSSNTIGCGWIDEFNTVIVDNSSVETAQAIQEYQEAHKSFIRKRVKKLSQQSVKRKSKIISCQSAISLEKNDKKSKQSTYFELIIKSAIGMHKNNRQKDCQTKIEVSFGVIRMANISPCIALTRFLLEYPCPAGMEIRVMPYHSQQVLLLRHEQEKHLDAVLKRKEKNGEDPVAFSNVTIRKHLDDLAKKKNPPSNVLFILVATPVEEIGRDHDFDWAIVEPSSYRSIIQLAGRVRRHREEEVDVPNIGLLQYNWRTIELGDESLKPRFYHPGYESKKRTNDGKKQCFRSHDLKQLLDEKDISQRIDAIHRIQNSSKTPRFAALEHAVIESQLCCYKDKGPETLQGYLTQYWYMTALPQVLNRFRNCENNIQLYRFYEENGELCFFQKDNQGHIIRDIYQAPVNMIKANNIHPISLTDEQRERLWLWRNYSQLLGDKAEDHSHLLTVALRLGELLIRESESNQCYLYNDQLGLFREERS